MCVVVYINLLCKAGNVHFRLIRYFIRGLAITRRRIICPLGIAVLRQSILTPVYGARLGRIVFLGDFDGDAVTGHLHPVHRIGAYLVIDITDPRLAFGIRDNLVADVPILLIAFCNNIPDFRYGLIDRARTYVVAKAFVRFGVGTLVPL